MIKKQAKKVNKNLGVNQKSLPSLPAKIKNSAKKLKVGFVYYLTSLLVFISLVSIGFASWTIITFPNGQTATGTITAYDVINTDDYIQLDKTKGDNNSGVKMFEISPGGFINGEKTEKTGSIIAYYNIDFGAINSSTAFDSTITLEFYLRGVNYENEALLLNIFNIYTLQATIEITGKEKVPSPSFANNATQASVSTTIDTTAYTNETVAVVVTFTFTLVNTRTFYENIVSNDQKYTKETEFFIHTRIY